METKKLRMFTITTFMVLILVINVATALKENKALQKSSKHVASGNRLSALADRKNILSNAADGVDESNENSIRRENKTTRAEPPFGKLKKHAITNTHAYKSVKVKLRKMKMERRLRRKKLRKLRLRKKTYGMPKFRNRKLCKSWSDCSLDECCLWQGNRRFCKKRPKRRQRCKPSILPGVGKDCPCQTGLTCSLPLKKRRKNKKKLRYRCVKVKRKFTERYVTQNSLQ